MVPGSPVVSAPLGRIALPTGVSGARNNEWPFIGPHAKHAITGRHSFEHSVNVVNPGVGAGSVVIRMHHIQIDGRRQTLGDEHRRLIHVREKPRNSLLQLLSVEGTPPITHSLGGEVWKRAIPRPAATDEEFSIRF